MHHEFPLLEAQQEIHELIAAGAPLTTTLVALIEYAKLMLPDALIYIMRFDPAHTFLSGTAPCL